jgi:HSP20 family protein
MALVRWQPKESFDLDRLFDGFWGPKAYFPELQAAWAPSVDVAETDEEISVVAELPSIVKEDVDVSVADGFLTIKGEKKRESETEDKRVHRVERSYGAFSRRFQLPAEIETESISAVYNDGVLTVTLPKAEAAKPKQIEVKVS